MPREQWLELRRNSIGGSDACSACGQSPWTSQLELWCDKQGMIPDKETNESMRRGIYLEEYVAQRFMEETGKTVRRDNFMYADDDYPCLTANLDRVIVGENSGLECKTMNDFSSSDFDFESGEIPIQYYYQLQHYMMVMKWDYMYIAFSTNFKFVWMKVDRNQEFIDQMRQQELDFWYNYVVKMIKPEADGSESSMETLSRLYPNETEGSVVNFNFDELGARYKFLTDSINRMDAEKKEIKAKICGTLGNYEKGMSANYYCTWKLKESGKINTKALKSDYPELYEKYKNPATRTFNLREIKRKEK